MFCRVSPHTSFCRYIYTPPQRWKHCVSSLSLFWGVATVMGPLAPDLLGGSESTQGCVSGGVLSQNGLTQSCFSQVQREMGVRSKPISSRSNICQYRMVPIYSNLCSLAQEECQHQHILAKLGYVNQSKCLTLYTLNNPTGVN